MNPIDIIGTHRKAMGDNSLILEKLNEMIADESKSGGEYNELASMCEDDELAQILRDIAKDENKHYESLVYIKNKLLSEAKEEEEEEDD